MLLALGRRIERLTSNNKRQAVIRAWMSKLFGKETEEDKWERYKKALAEDLKDVDKTGTVHKLCRKIEDELNLCNANEAKKSAELNLKKYLCMLGQSPKYITVEFKGGPVWLDPNKGIKAMYCGDRKIWQNPDYEKGGKYWVNPNSLTQQGK